MDDFQGAGSSAPFRGSTVFSQGYAFHISVMGKSCLLGTYPPESAEMGARLYDSLKLLLHGPRANTNFEWSSYTQADITAAAEVLQKRGVDVKAAVLHARATRTPSEWIGVVGLSSSWAADVAVYRGKGIPNAHVRWKQLQSAEVAAQQADCGLLAIHGLGCTTNFPASQYSKLQLEQAGECAISKGVDEMRVNANLEAVEKALKEGTLDAQVFSLQARRALFQSLDLIPPELDHGASPGAVDAAPQDLLSAADRPTQQPALSSKARNLPPKNQRSSWSSRRRRKLTPASGTSREGSDSDTSSDGSEQPAAAAPTARPRRLPLRSYRVSSSSSGGSSLSSEDDAGPAHNDQGCDWHRIGGSAAASLEVAPTSAAHAKERHMPRFAGATWLSRGNVYRFVMRVLGETVGLGTYKPEDAEAGVRLYDTLQLLLYGPRANTTFPWRTYTQSDVAAAAEVLKSKGLDVRQAVVHAREGRHSGQWTVGVARSSNRTAWSAQLCIYVRGGAPLTIHWGAQHSAEEAARQADCGLLAIHGLRCTTNFPASAYQQPQLVAAGEHAISKGVEAARVTRNLAAVQQARQEGTLDDHVASLQSRRELLKTLDLIPPHYTYEAARAAVQDAPQATTEAGPAPLPWGSKRQRCASHQGRKHQPCFPPQVQGAQPGQPEEGRHQQPLHSALPGEASLRGQLATGQGDAQATLPEPTLQLQTAGCLRAAPALATADGGMAVPDNTLVTREAVARALPILSTAANSRIADRNGLSRPPLLQGHASAKPRLEVRGDGALRTALHRREPAASRERMLRLIPPAGIPRVSDSVGNAARRPRVAEVQQAAAAQCMGRQAGGSHMLLLPWEVLAWEQTGGPLACLAGCCDD